MNFYGFIDVVIIFLLNSMEEIIIQSSYPNPISWIEVDLLGMMLCT